MTARHWVPYLNCLILRRPLPLFRLLADPTWAGGLLGWLFRSF